VESAQPRKGSSTTLTNHGGVCLYYEPSLHAWTIQLPVFSTFKVVATVLHHIKFNAIVIVICRPCSCNVTQSFFNNFCDLLERPSTFSVLLVIAGDFNIHVDDATNLAEIQIWYTD